MISRTGVAALALALVAAPTVVSAEPRAPMSAQDLVTLPRLGSPAASPDGRWVVYPVTTTDPATYERSTALYLQSVVGGGASPIKLDLGGSASDAAFGRDGWIYFISDRGEAGADGKNQVWRARLSPEGAASAPERVTAFPTEIAGFALAPSGNKIALWADIARDCPSLDCARSGETQLPGPGTGRLYDSNVGFVRHWDKWETPGKHSRVFAYDLVGGKVEGKGVALDGPSGRDALVGDTPTKPFGGGEEIAWAPDGSGVYFAARQSDEREPRSTNVDIWWSDLSGKAPVNLTRSNQATDTLPAPSPDGKWLAYAAMSRPGYESDKLTVMLRDVKTGRTRAVTTNWDRSPGSLRWTPDGKWLVATAQDVLDTPVFRIDPATGVAEKLDLMAGNEGHIGDVTPLADGSLLFTRSSVGAPPELYRSADWKQAEPLTDIDATLLGQRAPIVTRRFSFTGANGDTVWDQITKLDQGGAKMPVILYVHGGPQGSFDDSWSTRWNPRVVASQGFAVVSVDFHGSTGYGQAFTDSITSDWGGKPLEDLQKGLSAALALDPQIDGTRACAMGASYGGYMMNWIEGQWPDRFKCLVQHDGVFDARAMAYETEELWFDTWEHGGKTYFEDPAAYEKWNPVNHVARWKTPMLVVTSERDFRIPYTQGIAAFTALQMRDVPAQLLTFPDENHWVLKPRNSLQWHQTVFAWLHRWLDRK